MRDELFIRGSLPMTKSEVRAVSLSKLELAPGSVFWDIGAGTGSVAVEAARNFGYVDPSGNICDSAAETIRRKIMTNQATLNERKKYEAYIRNKARNGIELSDKQIHAYQESLSSRNAHKPGTGIIPYDAGLAARQMPPVEIRFGPANLTGKGYDAFVSHLREQQNELNRLSLYYTSDLELNLFLFHNDPNMVVHDANDKARRNARVYLGKGSGDVAHALDACAGGYLNNIPNRRPSRPQQQVGVGWKTNWTQIVPGRISGRIEGMAA